MVHVLLARFGPGYKNIYTLASSVCRISMATADSFVVAMLVSLVELAKVYMFF